MSPSFIHLRLHTEYSLEDSVIRIPQLVETVTTMGMPAIAITDQGNLFALVKFYKAAQSAGIKPIIGADLRLHDAGTDTFFSLTVLCCDAQGYHNLSALITRSYMEGQHHGVPTLKYSWFKEQAQGLIALSGGPRGDIGHALLAKHNDQARSLLDKWQKLFPERFYIEVQRTGREGEEDYLDSAVQLAANCKIPLVATNDVRFINREEFEAHEARVCIQSGHILDDPRRPRYYSEQQYLRNQKQMHELFIDLPEALENTVEIAKRCNYTLELGENYLPAYPIPQGHTVESYLRVESTTGLGRRLAKLKSSGRSRADIPMQSYQERLEGELEVILRMGFAGYFLIVADFIRWARQNGVPVGPGRGSGAGSLVAYALNITDLDPIEHDLLFERFLNPERVSMPDFDVDFCMEGRDRVIEYVAMRFGRGRVSQIITYGSMAARAVVRDVGRVLGHPYGFVDQIAKQIPFELDMTLDKALKQEQELNSRYQNEEEVRQLLDLARSLEGLTRNAGKHAGGVVIAPSELTDFMPLYCEAGGTHPVTQFDKDDVEAVGLVKFDFLGLRTLTIIDRAISSINQKRNSLGEAALDIAEIPMEDAETFELLRRCQTAAVFQLESRGMRDLIRRIKPDSFEDIVAVNALFRPGPLQSGMLDDFIARKHGKAKVDYLHPKLEPILKSTYGVILYQEQVMQIAQVLAGYSLGGADLLRRAMGKKKPEEMARQRSVFVQGAVERGVSQRLSSHIFDLMEKFAGYGFNKSHSAAYALLSYQTAWLKAHYPAAFMSAVLSSDMDHTDKVVAFIDECRNMQLAILPPDINRSEYSFAVADEKSIRYGLGAIKGVGLSAIEGVLKERSRDGVYKSLEDFCRRVDLQKANRRVIEALIRAGAMDALGPNRATLMSQLPAALAVAEQSGRADAAGQDDMFGLSESASTQRRHEQEPASLPDWDEDIRLRGEKETLGLYLTGHPITRYLADLEHVVTAPLGEVAKESPPQFNGDHGYGMGPYSRHVTVAGLVVDLRRRGGRVSLTLDDRSGRLEATLFDEGYNRFRTLAVKDRLIVVEGKLAFDEFISDWRVTVKNMYGVDELRERYVRRLDIDWLPDGRGDFAARLKEMLKPHLGGHCSVWVRYRGKDGSVPMFLGDSWKVHPVEILTRSLEAWLGPESITLHYGARPINPTREAVGA